MNPIKSFRDFMAGSDGIIYYFCESCGKTKTEPEIVNFVNSVTPQKISGLNIICKACHRDKNINTILDETQTT